MLPSEVSVRSTCGWIWWYFLLLQEYQPDFELLLGFSALFIICWLRLQVYFDSSIFDWGLGEILLVQVVFWCIYWFYCLFMGNWSYFAEISADCSSLLIVSKLGFLLLVSIYIPLFIYYFRTKHTNKQNMLIYFMVWESKFGSLLQYILVDLAPRSPFADT